MKIIVIIDIPHVLTPKALAPMELPLRISRSGESTRADGRRNVDDDKHEGNIRKDIPNHKNVRNDERDAYEKRKDNHNIRNETYEKQVHSKKSHVERNHSGDMESSPNEVRYPEYTREKRETLHKDIRASPHLKHHRHESPIRRSPLTSESDNDLLSIHRSVSCLKGLKDIISSEKDSRGEIYY